MSETVTVKEASDFLKVDVQVIRRYAREGKIRASKIGRSWLFKKCNLERYIEENDNSLVGKI